MSWNELKNPLKNKKAKIVFVSLLIIGILFSIAYTYFSGYFPTEIDKIQNEELDETGLRLSDIEEEVRRLNEKHTKLSNH